MRVLCGRPVSFPSDNADRWFHDEILPHEPMLRAWLRTKFPSLTDPDDLVQETFSRVLQARANAPITSPKAFLFTTARNLALDQVRRQKIIGIDALTETAAQFVYDDVPGAFQRWTKKGLKVRQSQSENLPTSFLILPT